ncbi:glutamine-hydrolyzing carbamoyl-phosphate synthase small subunit [Clostridium sp. 'deep sea']|uniref:glutamine-hydrolyzing carbamoyl-phosphate synthase small subunit n=1 Tax=Clostridium sp. 'deep sea' TaxID=2779445 RepID=UPI0018968CD2|nr:glutamine-hydrolyzing carbamoyl-phosphate synthase small subunit [Clostridium sp. 'deep sea']QOR35606.1 glutamine-hydrolyzing carbamoyl-phosphate synthase small subunit [Clostridium sp. 'deep sea']
MKQAKLILEDGTIFYGENFGFTGDTDGEVVFNTCMTGYQEIITDPSYRNQIVTLTYPLIGNYGFTEHDKESLQPQIKGLIVKKICHDPSNFRSECEIAEYLQKNEIVAISNIDTRALTKKLRNKGTMKGLITSKSLSKQEIEAEIAKLRIKSSTDLVAEVTTKTKYKMGSGDKKVVILDCGMKRNIARSLVERGCEVTVVPAHTTSQDILNMNPHGIILSNGPGDPEDVPYVINTVKDLLGKKPIFGICLGHQVLGLACGAKTYKLKFGHRGGNHPVKDFTNNRIYITSQNHGYAIIDNSLNNTDLEITHVNLTDNTVEGVSHKIYEAFSVQYHPEAAPGPEDSKYLFDKFVAMLKK